MGQVARVHDGHEYIPQHDSDGLGEWRHIEGEILAHCQCPDQQNIYGCSHICDIHLDSSGPETLSLQKFLLSVIVTWFLLSLISKTGSIRINKYDILK